jgi:hypothetical protein
LVKTVWLVPPEQRVELLEGDQWQAMTDQEKLEHNNHYDDQVWSDRELTRDDPVLVQVVKELGDGANARLSKLKIVEIPIIFTDRTMGQSKMSNSIIKEAIFGVISLRMRQLFNRL